MKITILSRGGKKLPYPLSLYLILVFLALLSTIGLDYLNGKKGGKSYFFSYLTLRRVPKIPEESLARVVRERLYASGIDTLSIREAADKEGLRLTITLASKEYRELEPLLEKEFTDRKALVTKKQDQEKDRDIFTWAIQGTLEERLALHFICPREELAKKKEKPPLLAGKQVALIIDDMGYSLDIMKEICSLTKPVTVSILPLSPYAWETAQMAHENGLEVMLHLPCESINHKESGNHYEDIIHSDMSEEDIRSAMLAFLEKVPHVKGVNNHMGSKITENESIMRIILEVLKEKGLYFLDSRTTGKSIAYDLAQRMGIPSAYRHVFLDSTPEEEMIRQQMIELFRLTDKRGNAVGIGHPYEETLRVLKKNISLMEDFGANPVFASKLVH